MIESIRKAEREIHQYLKVGERSS